MNSKHVNIAVLGFTNFNLYFNSAVFVSFCYTIPPLRYPRDSPYNSRNEDNLAVFFFLLGLAIAELVWNSTAIRKLGRKTCLLTSSLLFALVSYYSPNIPPLQSNEWLLFTRFLAGLTGSATVYLVPGMLADFSSPRQLTTSIVTFTMCAGLFSGTLAGNFFDPTQLIFISCAITVLLLLSSSEQPELSEAQKNENALQRYKSKITDIPGHFFRQSIVEGFFLAALYTFITMLYKISYSYYYDSACLIASYTLMVAGTGYATLFYYSNEKFQLAVNPYQRVLKNRVVVAQIGMIFTGLFMLLNYLIRLGKFNFLLPAVFGLVLSIAVTVSLAGFGEYVTDLYTTVPAAVGGGYRSIYTLVSVRFLSASLLYIFIMELCTSDAVALMLAVWAMFLLWFPALLQADITPTPSDELRAQISDKQKRIELLSKDVEDLQKLLAEKESQSA